MRPRPADWSPLASDDPAPGDPDEVECLARQYGDTAQEIRRQAQVLGALSKGDGWDSKAGRVFAEEAGDLARKLGKTHGRYAEVSRQLRRWAPALREAQDETLGALHDAKEADQRRRANQTSIGQALANALTATPQQQAADRRRQQAYSNATSDLAAARRRMDGAVDCLDRTAACVAQAIRDASDDDVKDSTWDKIKGAIRDFAGVLKLIAEIAGTVATLLAIAAFFIAVPLWLPLLVGGTLLLATTALAAAGEGSWLDVGFAVLEVIPPLKVAKAAKALSAARGAAARHAGAEAAAQVMRKNRVLLGAARWASRTPLPLGPLRGLALSRAMHARAAANLARDAAERAVWQTPLPTPSSLTKLRYLDRRMARYGEDANRLAREFYDSPEVMENIRRVRALVRSHRIGEGTKIVLDAANDVGLFDPVKPCFTTELRPMRW